MDAPESIIVNAEYHAKLLSTLAGLEYVPQAKKDQIEYVNDLEQQVEAGNVKTAELAAKTKKERKEHIAIRDSITKRFAHILVGKKEKFEQKASKEEREYVEALECEMTERDNQNTRLGMLEEGKKVLEELNVKEGAYKSAKSELQALYSNIFDGPTEAFPEEDRLEYAVIEATERHGRAQGRVNAESRAAELLAKATNSMSRSYQSTREALSYSTYDIWGFGGSNMSDFLERNALRSAQVYSREAGMFIEQARRISPLIHPIPRVQIAQGALVGDILFDNIFSDLAFQGRINESLAQLTFAGDRLTIERDAARNRTEHAGNELLETAEVLETRRRELDDFRRTTFERLVAQHRPPPDYDVSTTVFIPSADNRPSTVVESSVDDLEIDEFFQGLATARTSANAVQSAPPPQMPIPEATTLSTWARRNPFAFAISEQTRKLSESS